MLNIFNLKRIFASSGLPSGIPEPDVAFGTNSDRLRSCSRPAGTLPVCHAPMIAVIASILSLSSSLQAQNYNPNNYDTGKIIQEMRKPHNDLSLVVAHRGLHATLSSANDVPENSLRAIGDAAQAGIEIVEVDIKVTQDGVPILSHDTSWGREWCGLPNLGNGSNRFNPFVAPGNSVNDSVNPLVSATSLGNTRSFLGTTYLRPLNVLLANPTGCSLGLVVEYPPTLQDVLDYMTKNKIAVVLALDIKDDATAQICWRLIKASNDYRGNSYAQSVVFKMPGRVYKSAGLFEQAFGSDYKSVLFWPFYGTADIAPQTFAIDDSYGTDSSSASGFGSEQLIIHSLLTFDTSDVQLLGTEVNLKQRGGILTQVLAAAKVYTPTGGAASVGSFNPEAEYIDPSDASKTAQFFNAAGPNSAHCCYKLSDLFYNGAPNGQPSDTADNRGDLNFLIGNGDTIITTDSAPNVVSTLAARGLRNISYLQASSGGTSGASTCNIYASGGTPCVAAHSTVRALFGGYSGGLYQVKRVSDGTTTDIGALSNGYADAARQDLFCAGTTCTITIIYDQTFSHNNLSIEGPGGTVPIADAGASANALPIRLNGNAVYGVKVTSGVGYRNNATSGIATGGSPEGMYMVTSGTNVNNGCCFDYGNVETSGNDTGNGHMDALNFGTACIFGPCNGSGPWVEADLENGQYMGNGSNLGNHSISSDFVTAMLKNDGQTIFALKAGNAQAGGLTTEYSGSLPTINPGYIPMSKEGAIVLGTGGDNSNWGVGSFFEGAMTSGYPSDSTESAVQANIVAAGYTGSSGSASGNGTAVYAGPNDPGGPGPQDGFASPAIEQPNDLMGTKPALAFFNRSLFVAFQGVNANNNLYISSSSDGNNFPVATRYTNISIGSAPAMAEFNRQLYVAFQANDPGHTLHVTSSSDGQTWPAATQEPNIQIGSAPALAVFKNQLYVAFQANDPGHTLHVTSSSNGKTWPAAAQVPNVRIGSAPAMAVFNGKLYIAFRADDPSNDAWIASSSDGINFSSQVLSGQTMGGNSAPTLVASNNTLYYIYGADDASNEMLVTASTDGSTWQGPAAYLGIQMGPTGPAATAFGNGISVGFQSNDSRNVLFMTNKVTKAVYTGPNDPGGPGPQDGFISPAIEQPNVVMGTKPALLSVDGGLLVAFQGVNANNDLYLTGSATGSDFPVADRYTGISIGSAPVMANFNNGLYVAFQGNDFNHEFFVRSPTSATSATGYPDIRVGSAPALAVFKNQLYAAFQANDPGHTLHVTSSSDGKTWPAATQVPNIQIGSAPAMAVFNGKLYIAFRADDPSNDAWIASSSDGIRFSSQVLSGQTMGWNSAPALVVSNNTLYYIYGADDASNEMLVTASTDGSTWQGPAAYLGIHMGPTGPAATAFGNGISVGFQSNDSRNVLFVTNK